MSTSHLLSASSSDQVAPPSSEQKAGTLMVTLDGLIVAASSRSPPGFGNLADKNVRKGVTAFVTIEHRDQSARFETLLGGHLTRNNTVAWKPRDHKWRALDVSTPTSELVVKLRGTHNDPLFIPRFIEFTPTWSTRLKFSCRSVSSSRELVHFEAGGATIFLRLHYSEKNVPSFEGIGSKWGFPQPVGCTDLFRVERHIVHTMWEVDPSYAMKVVENADAAAKFEISHPFIAPLQFSLSSPDDNKLRVLSPMAAGGYLFSHLQKHRRFNVFLARLFAAQLICVLEFLHDHGIVFACMRPEYITVDAFGHISFCYPDVFLMDPQKKGNILPGKLEVPAPEVLLGQAPSHAADWWSLGILLYEMLTGLLPFSREDPEQNDYVIINHELRIEASVSPVAADILTRLLEKDHTKRLGVNGVSEVKAHAFFQEIDWNELLLRPSVARFEICDTNRVFQRSEGYGVRGRKQKHVRISGITYTEQTFDVHRWWSVTGRVRDKVSSNMTGSNTVRRVKNEWEVKWDLGSAEFCLHNHSTDEKRKIDEQTTNQIPWWPFPIAEKNPRIATDTDTGTTGTTISVVPSELQKRYALRAALEFNCSNRDVERILEFSPTVNLDFGVLQYQYAVDPSVSLGEIDGRRVFSQESDEVTLTPLEWAVEHGDIDLVNLFLARGAADANYTVEVKRGPALLKAVDKGP
ncbi:hypothetical protein NPX13_g4828 [Xylaria arbuscula]|uniref:Protein kinase domain-containing protein n=1 Tax=Xylaria arbuscula TaxID=114810 RepID=A0A9W8NFK6_9PEZI|nr:hypothetical protein NPX13_g4828 [Xylaria arbuscula]